MSMETISLKEAWDILEDKNIEIWGSERYLGRNSLTQDGVGSEYWMNFLESASISKMFIEVISELPNTYMWEITDDSSTNRVESLSCYRYHEGKNRKVGWVTLNHYDDVVELRNYRIRKNMQRKDHVCTSDAKKLGKDIKRWFKPLSHPEQLQERMHAMDKRVDSATMEASYKQQKEVGEAMAALTDHVMANLDEFKPLLTAVHSEQRLDELAQVYADTEVVLSVKGRERNSTNVKTTTKVLITDDWVIATNGNYFQSYKPDRMPYELRKKLGMLKLLDDETFAINVGYRDRADLYTLTGDLCTEYEGDNDE